jgi:hypothetical protein
MRWELITNIGIILGAFILIAIVIVAFEAIVDKILGE